MIAKRKTRNVRTLAELAAALGKNRRTVSDWVKAPGFPRNKNGTYNIDHVSRWADERERKGRASIGVGVSCPDLKEALLRAELAVKTEEARTKKLKNDQAEGLLLPADDVRQWIAEKFLRIKQRLEQMPDSWQVSIPSELRPQVHADMSRDVYALLLEMSGWEFDPEITSDD